ncbi:MAG: PAS domain-containing protein [Candidatus Eremiobacteraeota bacterium]|nr:PAS domain-containing protein [Candidatus Eremiobacteraeota bacterium]
MNARIVCRSCEREVFTEAARALGYQSDASGGWTELLILDLRVPEAQALWQDYLAADPTKTAVLVTGDREQCLALLPSLAGRTVDVLVPPIEIDRVSARIARLAQLHRPESFLEQLIEHIPHMIFVKEANTLRFVHFNAAGERLLGIPRQELIGKRDQDFFPPHESDFFTERDREVIAQGEPLEIPEEPVQTRFGERFLRTIKIPIRDGQGRICYLLGLSEDITEQKRAEAALRGLQARLRSAQERERLYIAREVHDELGQLLTALKLDIAWLERRLENDPAFRDKLDGMTELVDSTIGTARRIAHSLRPQILDDLGLLAGLDWLVREICERGGVRCQVNCDFGDGEPSEDVRVALFRICQEALTNVVRHAGATQAEISLKATPGSVRLVVEDNGQGIAAEDLSGVTLGLAGMRERAELFGGQLKIEPGAQRGTRLEVILPTC